MHHGKCIDEVMGYRVIECEACGFAHIDPVPTEEELERLYAEEYYSKEKPLFIERQIEDLEWWNAVYDERYDFFEKLLGSGKGSILDIGCGTGFFLKRGVERGWSCLGVEPSRQAASLAAGTGVNVLNMPLDAQLGKTMSVIEGFDVVHMSEVLEHMADPLAVCKRAHALLKDNGLFCVVVPNDYNPLQGLLRADMGFKPYWLSAPHHINYFNFSSLGRLLDRAGFDVVHRTATFPMELFLLMGDNYVGDDAMGRTCHGRRKRLEAALQRHGILSDFKKGLYNFLAEWGMGREMVFYAVKQGA